jgi:hypothetical protein
MNVERLVIFEKIVSQFLAGKARIKEITLAGVDLKLESTQVPDSFQNLACDCVSLDPTKRPSALEAFLRVKEMLDAVANDNIHWDLHFHLRLLERLFHHSREIACGLLMGSHNRSTDEKESTFDAVGEFYRHEVRI